MSWFKKKINTYEIGSSGLEGDERNNPYMSQVTEEFVKIPIVHNFSPLAPRVVEESENGSTNQPPNLPSQ
jgi:hypothetical protein